MNVLNNMVFLAMGEMYARQGVYALLSLLKVYRMRLPDSLHVIVYTNVPDLFLQLQAFMSLETVYLSSNKFTAWKGPSDQVLRTKISLIKEVASLNKGNIILADTDIFFFKKIDALLKLLDQGNCLLHKKEAPLSTKDFEQYLESFSTKNLSLKLGKRIRVSGNQYMWNSGVIGLPANMHYIIDDVLTLNDQMFKINNLRLVEQLAFSIVLTENADVKECHNEIFHYCWNDGKDKMDMQIIKLLKDTEGESVEKQVQKMDRYRVYYPSMKDKLLYFSKPHNFLAMLKRKVWLLRNSN